jgi:hypothetical protein
MQDRQDEVGAILAQIAMIAEEVNAIALEGSGECRIYAEQLGCMQAVQLRLRTMFGLATGTQEHMAEGAPSLCSN